MRRQERPILVFYEFPWKHLVSPWTVHTWPLPPNTFAGLLGSCFLHWKWHESPRNVLPFPWDLSVSDTRMVLKQSICLCHIDRSLSIQTAECDRFCSSSAPRVDSLAFGGSAKPLLASSGLVFHLERDLVRWLDFLAAYSPIVTFTRWSCWIYATYFMVIHLLLASLIFLAS